MNIATHMAVTGAPNNLKPGESMSRFAGISRLARLALLAGVGALAASVTVHAATTLLRKDGHSDFIGLAGGPSDVVYRKLVTPAGETTGGWHYHPGFVYNVVESGTVTVEDGCGEIHSYSAGDAFETSEGRVHRAYNLSSVDAVENNMFILAPGRPLSVPIPGNVRKCGPANRVGECMDDGWKKFNHPHAFDSQSACIAYVNSRAVRTLLVPADPRP